MATSSAGNRGRDALKNGPALYPGLLPVLLLFVLLIGFRLFLRSSVAHEPPLLLPVLNTVFLFLVSCIVSYFAGRSYLLSGSPTVILLGCGVLTLGTGALAAGWLIGPEGPNVNVTIFNVAALLSSMFHAMGAGVDLWQRPPEADPARRRRKVLAGYLGVVVFVALLALTASAGVVPRFFVQGVGPTALRQAVVAVALVLFAGAASYGMSRFITKKREFFYWYSLALFLLAMTLVGALLQPAVGSLLGWVSRCCQYLAGIYFFLSVRSALRDARARGVSADEAMAEVFCQSERKISAILSSIPDGHYELDREWRFIRINDHALAYFGRSKREFIGQSFWDVFPVTKGSVFEERYRKVVSEGSSAHFEQQSAVLPDKWIEFHVYPTEEAGISVFFRDVTEMKRARIALQESEQRWATTLASIGDAVIATDTNGRITFMNAVAEELTGWTLAAAATRPVTEVFHIINEQTLKGVEDPVAKVLREGMIVGLANHTLLVRKDGTETPIDDSGAPIRDADGTTTGVVLVFRDIGERRRAEKDLRESESKLRLFIEHAPAAVAMFDRAMRYVAVSRRWLSDYGLSDENVIGRSHYEVFPEIPEQWKEVHRRCLAGATENAEEDPFPRLDGKTDWVSWEVRPWYEHRGDIGGIIILTEVVTARKEAEERQRESEELYRSIVETATEGIWIGDTEARTTFVNKRMADMLGYSPAELTGRLASEFMDEEARILAKPNLERRLEGMRDTYEQKYLRKDGTTLWALTSGAPLRNKEGCVVASLAILTDITEHKLQEARITRLTQLYAMLSRVNETIVRTHDRTVLFDDVCRIVAGEGAFPLVWIGEVRGRQVEPVAWQGPAVDYLAEIRVEKDGALGQGPTGTCIREDHPIINDDFETNTTTAPWREAALQRGFRTSAAFPLHLQGKAVAALTIYAARPHDFDAEQVVLLQSLAADISYALDAMEQEKLRTQAETDLQHSLSRFELLSHTARELLQSPDPQRLVNSLCREVMAHLGCQAFFNFLAVEEAGRLRLNAYAGIPEAEAEKIAWLDYGVAVCGCAAQDACRIVAEHIPTTFDPRTELVKSFGIKAYACHPLFGPEGSVMGTLSFGTCDRETFSDDDLSLMKAVADQVAVAMMRMKDEEAVRRSRDALEERVQERTAELQQAYDKLMRETEEREQVEQQLRQAQKMEALGTMSGGIAHDFNNILAAIIGFGELLADHVGKGSREERHVRRIMEAGVRGRDLVKQMLAFSRKTEQEKKPLHLSGIIEETVKLLRATTPATIIIKARTTNGSGVILGDPTQIQQVLMNLCTNATYAMREKGGVIDIELSDVSVSPTDGDPHRMEPGPYVKLTVRDTGIGIPPEIIDKIFDPFFTTKKVGEGTGLGLSVVHGIVKQSSGSLFVESDPGKGSTFTVYFPEISGERQTERPEETEIPTGSERILFVDDEEALVEMGEDILAELGYEVTSRTNGREALSLLKEDPSRFDLIITDVTMPEMTGVDLAREALTIQPEMPIIMCTGYSHLVDADAARPAGVKAFAMKPLTKREIARTIRHVLDE